MGEEVAAAFGGLGCAVGLLVQPLHGSGEVAVEAEQPVVAASVFKVLVALVVESRFAQRQLDPRERVVLPAARRTPGPVGFSLFADDVQVSLRDLVTAMLTVSDNVATDTLIGRVGVQTLNATAAELGLDHTHVVSDLQTLLDSIGHDAGSVTTPPSPPGNRTTPRTLPWSPSSSGCAAAPRWTPPARPGQSPGTWCDCYGHLDRPGWPGRGVRPGP